VDLATVIGLVLGTVLVVSSNLPAFLLVVGGTLGVTFIKNPLDRVFSTVSVVKNAFTTRVTPTRSTIDRLVELSRKARRESLLSLEKVEVDNEFLQRSIRLAVDGMEPSTMRNILETEIHFLHQRHRSGQELMEGVAVSAPAFGMIGTLIGLVNMLASMDDPASLGTAMAVAILTTLYGALIAHLFANPIAEKLKTRSREEVVARMIILQGVLSIVEGDHPASVEQKLLAFLEPRQREEEDSRAA
jgi:chemotaxis protein MotA